MKTNPNRFWTIVILLGWAFDVLFWKKPLGINFLLYLTLSMGTGILLLRADGLRPAPRSRLLLAPLALLGGMTFLRLEPMSVFLAISMSLFLLGTLTITYLSGEWQRFGVLDYFGGYLRLLGSLLARPLGFAAQVARERPEGGQKGTARIWPALRGLVIALPVVAVFAALLSSADPIFANRLDAFVALFNIENLPEYIVRLVLILLLAYGLAGAILHAASASNERAGDERRITPFLGFTEAAIVLGSVAILFAVFVVIQFQYFFGGQANISVEGYTFSEYARRGFGELVAVAFFSLLLLLGLGAVTRRETEVQRRVFSAFGVGLVVLVMVMLVSAFQRLVLYEMTFGYSRLRTYTHVFMIWLGILLVTIVFLEIRRRERAIAPAIVLTVLGFVISLNILNVDAFIVHQNVRREIIGAAEQGEVAASTDLDAQYFLELSDDAVPALVNAYRSQRLPTAIREKIGASLVCIRHQREEGARALPWQSFHLSRLAADRALAEVDAELDSYVLKDSEFPLRVESPSGGELLCWQYYLD